MALLCRHESTSGLDRTGQFPVSQWGGGGSVWLNVVWYQQFGWWGGDAN